MRFGVRLLSMSMVAIAMETSSKTVVCAFSRLFCDNLVSGVPSCVVEDFYPDWGCENEVEVAKWLAYVPDVVVCPHFIRSRFYFPVSKSYGCYFGGGSCVCLDSYGFSACRGCSRFHGCDEAKPRNNK